MTYNDIINIANRLDKETKKEIDKAVEDRLEILKEGELSKEDMEKMEEYLYMTLVIEEYLSGEYGLLEEEKALLLLEMEEMYNEYGEILSRAKLEEKISKKKRMALELMKIREELMKRKDRVKDVNDRMKENLENQEKFLELTGVAKMEEIAQDNKNKLNNKEDSKIDFSLDKDNKRMDIKDKENKREENRVTQEEIERENAQRQRDKIDAYQEVNLEMESDPLFMEYENAMDSVSYQDDLNNLYGQEARNSMTENDIQDNLRNYGQDR